jgi:anaerobic selenocysteine-containing dehydrogenase
VSVTHIHSCTLCEATCGIAVTVEGDRVVDIRGDRSDPHSAGYICPKATALADLHHDPDRLRRPVRRTADGWCEIGWTEAFDLVAAEIRKVRAEHGRDALAIYVGNPAAHNLGLLTFGLSLFRGLRTRNQYSATSLDQLPHMLAALLMLGNQLLMPVPDIDRTDLFVCLGGNPLVSNGSIMTAPNVRDRFKALRARGGRLVVIDPRRTETAAVADEHLFIRPGTDALLLLSLVNVLFAEGLVRAGKLAGMLEGLAELQAAAAEYPPEATAPATGVPAAAARMLARDLARTRRAVLYGRVGACTQEFGGLTGWLLVAINALTGHLDEPGGAMFTTPAIDPITLAGRIGQSGGFARWHSRVRGLPEFGGELPVAALAEEIETPGAGQVRAMLTAAGNPVLSAPNGQRLERALAGLDFMVAIDPYINETTRFAHVILPPTGPLERSHYELALAMYAVRNGAKYSPAVFARGPDQRHDWEICLELTGRLLGPDTRAYRRVAVAAARLVGRFGPEGLLRLGLRAGPSGLTLAELRRRPHGVDLGPLRPRLPERLGRQGRGRRRSRRPRDRRIELAPPEYLADLPRLRDRLRELTGDADGGDDRDGGDNRDGGDSNRVGNSESDGNGDGPGGRRRLVLIGRRQTRSNNSWMHNSRRLVKGRPRCTLLIHPDDARARGLGDGDLARVTSRTGTIEAPVEITDAVMPGVVSLPHGWGHGRKGVRLAVAVQHAGTSVNDITDDHRVDALTGTAALSGVPVDVVSACSAR